MRGLVAHLCLYLLLAVRYKSVIVTHWLITCNLSWEFKILGKIMCAATGVMIGKGFKIMFLKSVPEYTERGM